MNVFYYVYAIRSLKDRKLYFGFTDNLRRKFLQHQNGKVSSTKGRIPFELIFYEAYRNKYDALKREKYLKTSKGETTIKSMLKEFLNRNEDTKIEGGV